ncbi:MAG: MFS transporter [Gemmataceae bacterium]
MAVRAILRSFAHRNFRLFFTGQGLSLIGTWMQQTALPWLVYSKTGSPLWLAAVSFAGQFPAVFLAPIAGVYADQLNKRRVLLVTQTLSMLQAFLLAFMAYTDRGGVWTLLVLNASLSAVNSFDLTSRQALLNEMVESKEDLGNAIALNSSFFNSARLIGPAIAGYLIPIIHESGCFVVNGLSFLAVLVSLAAMRLKPRVEVEKHPSVWEGLRDGLRYSRESFPIRAILVLVALIGFFGVPYNVLLPVVADKHLHGGAETYGWLLATSGLGALTGALFLASRSSVFGLLRPIVLTPAVVGVCLLSLSLFPSRWAALPLVFLIGLCIVSLLTTCNTVLQTIVADKMRGRLLSLYAMTFMGLAPLGGLLAGTLTRTLGIVVSLQIIGSALIAGATLFIVFVSRPMRDQAKQAIREKNELADREPFPAEADA